MKRNEILGEISDKALRRYKQDAHTEIQGAKFGKSKGTPEGEKTIAKREKGMAAANKRLSARDDERRASSKPRPIPKVGGGPEDSYGKNRYMGDSVEEGEQNVAEGSAHGYNVVRFYRKFRNSSKITTWLKQQAGLPKETKLYFDDADLVLGSDTVVPEALVDDTLKFNDLLTALMQVTGGTPKEKTDGVYRDREVAEAEQRMSRAAKGNEKYGKDGMKALAKAGRDGASEKTLDTIRDKHDNYDDKVDENANMLKVAKDDETQTILQNPSTGVQTQIDKKNPNAPRLTQDEQGKLKLAAPMGAGGQQQQEKPNLVGKDVEVATESAALTAILKIAGLR